MVRRAQLYMKGVPPRVKAVRKPLPRAFLVLMRHTAAIRESMVEI
jgi:hypothetical protein